MFTDDFCSDWDSTKNQDDFIKKYFKKVKMNPAKTPDALERVSKSKNITKKNRTTKLVKQDNEYNDCEKSSSQLLKNKRSYEMSFETTFQPQNMQDEPESNIFKKKKRKKKSKKMLNESTEYMNIEELNSKYKTVTDPTDSKTCVDLEISDVNSVSVKSKKKRKRVRNKTKTLSEGKTLAHDNLHDVTKTVSDAIPCDSPVRENNNNSDFSRFKVKNRNKGNNIVETSEREEFFENEECMSIEDSHDLSLKKKNLPQSKAYQKLQAAKFRYLNEMLYTNSGKEALSYFQENTDEFMDYHEGYQSQVSKWPINPVDIIIQEISRIDKQAVVADLGCGEAKIAEVFPDRTIYSFDLIALKDCVTSCDISNVPLLNGSVDVVVFCLSLMGTNWKDYLKEGYRILKFGGTMKIAEIESRIDNLEHFIKAIQHGGFSLLNQNLSHKMFIFLNFKKVKKSKKASKIPAVTLKPCMYKKR